MFFFAYILQTQCHKQSQISLHQSRCHVCNDVEALTSTSMLIPICYSANVDLSVVSSPDTPPGGHAYTHLQATRACACARVLSLSLFSPLIVLHNMYKTRSCGSLRRLPVSNNLLRLVADVSSCFTASLASQYHHCSSDQCHGAKHRESSGEALAHEDDSNC